MPRVTRSATTAATKATASPNVGKKRAASPKKVAKEPPSKKRTTTATPSSRQTKRTKKEEEEESESKPQLKSEPSSESDTSSVSPPPSTPPRSSKPPKSPSKTKKSPADKAAALQDKKLKSFAQYSNTSPFPDFPHPTPEECRKAHHILSTLHGARVRPKEVIARDDRAGCGDSPSVLDALVRTILSQNTSDKNSTRAKKSMDTVYGRHDKWDLIASGGVQKLEEAIRCGGLSQTKSKVIMSILNQTHERYGSYSLDHLHEKGNEEAMREMISFQGVGPKTASCVLLFCLGRESFAVDTHVFRITGHLGWRPKEADRDETHRHLDIRIPDEEKFGLHILLVTHGKQCAECKAGGRSSGKCELRKAFSKGKGTGVKKEEDAEVVKQAEDEDGGESKEFVDGKVYGGEENEGSMIVKEEVHGGLNAGEGKVKDEVKEESP